MVYTYSGRLSSIYFAQCILVLSLPARRILCWMAITALSTPFSDRILSPILAAFSLITVLVVALTRASAISSDRRDGTFKPTPSFATRIAQKNWSLRRQQRDQPAGKCEQTCPNHGLIKVGIPVRRLAPTVPRTPVMKCCLDCSLALGCREGVLFGKSQP